MGIPRPVEERRTKKGQERERERVYQLENVDDLFTAKTGSRSVESSVHKRKSREEQSSIQTLL